MTGFEPGATRRLCLLVPWFIQVWCEPPGSSGLSTKLGSPRLRLVPPLRQCVLTCGGALGPAKDPCTPQVQGVTCIP